MKNKKGYDTSKFIKIKTNKINKSVLMLDIIEALENNLRLLKAIQLDTGYVTFLTQQHLKSLIKKLKDK